MRNDQSHRAISETIFISKEPEPRTYLKRPDSSPYNWDGRIVRLLFLLEFTTTLEDSSKRSTPEIPHQKYHTREPGGDDRNRHTQTTEIVHRYFDAQHQARDGRIEQTR